MKKFISFVLVLCLLFAFSPPIHAIGNINEFGNATVYGQTKPTKVWDWSKGSYSFNGIAGMSDLYSNYRFSNANRVEIYAENAHSSHVLTIKLLKVQTGIDFSVSTVKIQPGEYKTWSVSLNSGSQYILKFYAPSEFSGYIKKLS